MSKIDKKLLSKYPSLDNVISFLGANLKTNYQIRTFRPFDELGIKTEEEFIKLI